MHNNKNAPNKVTNDSPRYRENHEKSIKRLDVIIVKMLFIILISSFTNLFY